MAKGHIRETIRKLLRRSKSTSGPEAELARERAAALMEKHRIHVELSEADDYERRVLGVVNHYWRSELLIRIARLNECYLVRYDLQSSRKPKLKLQGQRACVESAWWMYSHVFHQITGAAIREWGRISPRLQTEFAIETEVPREEVPDRGYSDLMGSFGDGFADGFEDALGTAEYRGILGALNSTLLNSNAFQQAIAARIGSRRARRRSLDDREMEIRTEMVRVPLEVQAPVWFAAFLGEVSRTICQRLDKMSNFRLPAPAPEPAQRGGAVVTAHEREREVERRKRDAQALAAQVGADATRDLARRAAEAGKRVAFELNWNWRGARLLMAVSTVPVPPLTRFSRLDLDLDRVEAPKTEAPSGRHPRSWVRGKGWTEGKTEVPQPESRSIAEDALRQARERDSFLSADEIAWFADERGRRGR